MQETKKIRKKQVFHKRNVWAAENVRKNARQVLFALLGGRFGLSRKQDMPKWMKSKWFRYGFLIFFFAMFFQMLWNTYLVFAGAQGLKQVVCVLPDGYYDTANLQGQGT